MSAQKLTVEFDPSRVSQTQIEAALNDAGYPVET
ncbi:MAG: hypothetical protein QOF01_4702 [Thermomicrobiales bacterium]|jgi:copper chaperone CopZ|nr:hypothetical protein [Thermomicrobiales bacterium]